MTNLHRLAPISGITRASYPFHLLRRGFSRSVFVFAASGDILKLCITGSLVSTIPMLTRNLDKFKEISAAYEVLSDEQKRALYDQYGEAGVKSTVGGASGTYTMCIGHQHPCLSLTCTFSYIMGGFPGMDQADLRYDITLELSEAIFGSEKEFDLTHLETCEACAGTGAKAGSKMRICSTCGGRGQVMRTEQTPFFIYNFDLVWVQNIGSESF